MDINRKPYPSVLIDFKKRRIRIHKNTLRMLSCPEYVLLLVNPIDRIIAIKASDRSDQRAHHLSWSAAARRKPFEVYSLAFMDELRLCSDWDDNHVYRIYGQVVEECGLVQFRIDDASKYMNTSEIAEENG